jgi:UDP-N-acetylglucosamine 2-epimerase (non-hydrolysing)
MAERLIKLCLIAGARPNFMKIAPLIRAVRARSDECQWSLVHTGQHYDREMSDVFFEELEIPKPDYHLDVGSGSHAQQTAGIMLKFESVCQEIDPDCVVVVGDVNSTLACSIVAKKLGVEVVHVEAGLRSGDRTMPEEINRLVTDSITDIFFTTEDGATTNLKNEGVDASRIHFVGHVMIDNLYYQLEKLNRLGAQDRVKFRSEGLFEKNTDYVVVTLHRPSNVDDPSALKGLLQVLIDASEKLPIVFPVHPRTRARLDALGIAIPSRLILTEPLSYMDFLNLWSKARLVVTDSGGLQEETTALGVQCITVRENTERPITIDVGTNVLGGTNPTSVAKAIAKNLGGSQKVGKIPDMWDGKASDRIVDALVKHFSLTRSGSI